MAYKQKSEDLSNITRAMSDRATYGSGDEEKNDDKVYNLGYLDEVEITPSENSESKPETNNSNEIPSSATNIYNTPIEMIEKSGDPDHVKYATTLSLNRDAVTPENIELVKSRDNRRKNN